MTAPGQPNQEHPAWQGPSAASPYQPSARALAQVRRRRIIIGTILGAVLLVGGGLFGWFWWTTTQSESASNKAMTGLLTALRDADAQTAISYLDTESMDLGAGQLLTDQALAANHGSFTFNPNYVVKATDDGYAYQASISIDGVAKVVEWDVVKSGGRWLVSGADVLTVIDLDPNLPYVINQIVIEPGSTDLVALPGSYTVTSGRTLLTYDPAQANFNLYTGGQTGLNTKLVLADGVQQQVIEQVRALLAGCIAERSQPTACRWPIAFSNGEALANTITWTLDPPDPAAKLDLPLTGWNATDNYTQQVFLRFTAKATGQGRTETGAAGDFNVSAERTTYFNVDLSGTTPVVALA